MKVVICNYLLRVHYISRFKKKGYETNFYYGGKLGWRDIGKYFRYQKYDNLYGENAIKKQLNLSGRSGTEWGVYDEHLFNGILAKLKNSKIPQFVLALSTTNHPPFETPSNYPKKKIEIPDNLKNKVSREKDIFLSRFFLKHLNILIKNLLSLFPLLRIQSLKKILLSWLLGIIIFGDL